MKCSTTNCLNEATLQMLGRHPLCRSCGDVKNAKARARSARARARGQYSPSIEARWGEKKRERMRTKYTQRHDGEGFEIPNLTPYKLACCDCGLVHKIVLAAPGVGKGVGIGFATERDNRATTQRRRAKS